MRFHSTNNGRRHLQGHVLKEKYNFYMIFMYILYFNSRCAAGFLEIPSPISTLWNYCFTGGSRLRLFGLVTSYGPIELGQHCSGNGLLPDGTKPLPEPMLTYHQGGLVAFDWWHPKKYISMHYVANISTWTTYGKIANQSSRNAFIFISRIEVCMCPMGVFVNTP